MIKINIWNKLSCREKNKLLTRNQSHNKKTTALVKKIVTEVKKAKDSALKKFCYQYEKICLESFKVSEEEFASTRYLDEKYQEAIKVAYQNIIDFHQIQIPKDLSLTQSGIFLRKIFRPIENVGLYVPSGTAPLVSTLLMLAVPAKLAGCKNIVITTPPNLQGKIHPAILFAAKLCNLNQVFKVGGAQAIAALAFGTQSIPKVDKIFGPGNQFVTEAKIQVARDPSGAALDMPAGPSEVLVIADNHAKAPFVASDLLAQAEHDSNAKVVLLTTSVPFAQEVMQQIILQKKQLNRLEIVEQSLKNLLIIVCDSVDECVEISNQYAPEHLILQIDKANQYIDLIHNAGSIFLGDWSPEAIGDYASGTNHVLPTYGYAKSYSGLSVMDFMKSITVQEISKKGLLSIGPYVEKLAELENLLAHKNSVSLRLDYLLKERNP